MEGFVADGDIVRLDGTEFGGYYFTAKESPPRRSPRASYTRQAEGVLCGGAICMNFYVNAEESSPRCATRS